MIQISAACYAAGYFVCIKQNLWWINREPMTHFSIRNTCNTITTKSISKCDTDICGLFCSWQFRLYQTKATMNWQEMPMTHFSIRNTCNTTAVRRRHKRDTDLCGLFCSWLNHKENILVSLYPGWQFLLKPNKFEGFLRFSQWCRVSQ